jgi:hypothetical protein
LIHKKTRKKQLEEQLAAQKEEIALLKENLEQAIQNKHGLNQSMNNLKMAQETIGKSVAELYVPVPAKEKVLAVVQEAGCLIENFNPMEQDPKGTIGENNKEIIIKRLAYLCAVGYLNINGIKSKSTHVHNDRISKHVVSETKLKKEDKRHSPLYRHSRGLPK